jgi:hypothetical protein
MLYPIFDYLDRVLDINSFEDGFINRYPDHHSMGCRISRIYISKALQ